MKFFLDIDGVMVHADPRRRVDIEEDGFYKFDREAVNNLNSVFEYEDDFEVIISSSHRHRYSVDEWKQIFYRRNIYIHNLSILDLPFNSYMSRREEISYWINERHLSPDEFVIIDDDKSLNGLPNYIKDRVLLTNPYRGLDREILIKFDAMFSALKKLQPTFTAIEKLQTTIVAVQNLRPAINISNTIDVFDNIHIQNSYNYSPNAVVRYCGDEDEDSYNICTNYSNSPVSEDYKITIYDCSNNNSNMDNELIKMFYPPSTSFVRLYNSNSNKCLWSNIISSNNKPALINSKFYKDKIKKK